MGPLLMIGLGREGAQYASAEVLLFDASPVHRGTTRVALGMVGFKHVVATSDLEELVQAISQRSFDVLVADLAGHTEELCKIVRDIRHGDLGANPFLVTMLTTWLLREDVAGKVMNSGADDVLVRPYSVSFLAERVRTLVEARKGFVVTNAYIGPDRRSAGGRNEDSRLLEVPNTLRLKARPAERVSGVADVMTLVRDAQSKLDELRLQATSLQMRLLAHFALMAAADGSPLDKYLTAMSSVSKLLFEHLQGSSDRAAASTAVLLYQAVESISRGENVMESLSNLTEYASTLHAMLNAQRNVTEREGEFARAVKRLSTRDITKRQTAA